MTDGDRIKYLRIALMAVGLIWFTIWSSAVHAGIMAVQSIANRQHIGHLWGDVAALIIVAAVLAALVPRPATGELQRPA